MTYMLLAPYLVRTHEQATSIDSSSFVVIFVSS
jgi:hypothetical protein